MSSVSIGLRTTSATPREPAQPCVALPQGRGDDLRNRRPESPAPGGSLRGQYGLHRRLQPPEWLVRLFIETMAPPLSLPFAFSTRMGRRKPGPALPMVRWHAEKMRSCLPGKEHILAQGQLSKNWLAQRNRRLFGKCVQSLLSTGRQRRLSSGRSGREWRDGCQDHSDRRG